MEERKASKAGLLALIAVLVIVIAGAAVLYPRLSEQVNAQQAEAADQAEAPDQADDAQAEDSAQTTQEPADVADDSTADAPAATEAPAAAGPVQRYMATDFTVYDADGQAVRLSDMRGKPVVVNFFASWCGPCKMEMPYFEECYKEYGDQVIFMMVDLCGYDNDTREAADEMVAAGGYTFPVYYDTDGSAMMAYAIRSMPTTIFVSADGELKGRQTGAMNEATLRATVEKMAAEQ